MNGKFFTFVFLVFNCFAFGVGCSDAERAKFSGFASPHSIECYSGGTLIYRGVSTGKVLSEKSSDGYYFKEKATGRLMEVSGNCVIKKMGE